MSAAKRLAEFRLSELDRGEKVETLVALAARIEVLEERQKNVSEGAEYLAAVARSLDAARGAKAKVDASI